MSPTVSGKDIIVKAARSGAPCATHIGFNPLPTPLQSRQNSSMGRRLLPALRLTQHCSRNNGHHGDHRLHAQYGPQHFKLKNSAMLARDVRAAHGECLVIRARASGAGRQSMDLSGAKWVAISVRVPFIGVPYYISQMRHDSLPPTCPMAGDASAGDPEDPGSPSITSGAQWVSISFIALP